MGGKVDMILVTLVAVVQRGEYKGVLSIKERNEMQGCDAKVVVAYKCQDSRPRRGLRRMSAFNSVSRTGKAPKLTSTIARAICHMIGKVI